MNIVPIALFIAGIIFIAGLTGRIKKICFPANITIVCKKGFVALAFILLLAFILAYFNTYLRGYWTTKVAIWLFIFTGSLLFAFGERQNLSKLWRIFTGLVFYFPLMSIFLFLIPFLGFVLAVTIWGRILGYEEAVYYNDNEIRIQSVFNGPMANAGPPNIFKKTGLFEVDKGPMQINFYENPDSLKVNKSTDTITIYFYHNSNKDTINPIPFKFKR